MQSTQVIEDQIRPLEMSHRDIKSAKRLISIAVKESQKQTRPQATDY